VSVVATDLLIPVNLIPLNIVLTHTKNKKKDNLPAASGHILFTVKLLGYYIQFSTNALHGFLQGLFSVRAKHTELIELN